MKISIIIAAYRAAPFIEECLRSVVAQNLEDYGLEVLVGIDGCDETRKVLSDLRDDFPTVRFFDSAVNVGTYQMFNALAVHSTGDYLSWFGADDVMLEGYLSSHEVAICDGVLAVRSRSRYFDENMINPEKAAKAHDGVFTVERGLFFRLGGFMPWRCAADSDFLVRMSKHGIRVKTLDSVGYHVRRHPGQVTKSNQYGMLSKKRNGYIAKIEKHKAETVPSLGGIGVASLQHLSAQDVDDGGLRVVRYDSKNGYLDGVFVGPLANLLSKPSHRKPDILLVQWNGGNWHEQPAKKRIVHLLGTDCLTSDLSMIVRNANGVMFPSHAYMREALKREPRLASLPHRVCYVSVGKEFSYRKTEWSSKRIIMLGRVTAIKRIALGIEICRELRKSGDWSITIAGPGVDHSYHGALIDKYADTSWIRLHDPVPYHKVPELLADHDVLLSLSTNESVHRVALEAMALGLKVCVLDRLGAADIFPADRIFQGPANIVDHLLTWKPSEKRMREVSDIILNQFSEKAYVDTFKSLFDEVMVK